MTAIAEQGGALAGAARGDARPGIGRARLLRLLWIAPVVLALCVTIVYPTVFLLALAVTRSTLGRPFGDIVWLGQFGAALADPVFMTAVAKSVVYAFAASALQLAAGLGIALLLTGVKSGRLLLSFILLPLMTPPVMVGVAWKLILAPAGGLLNGTLLRLGVVSEPISFLGTPGLAWLSIATADLWQWTPFVVILCYAALATIPEGVREAATVDGASALQRLVHVTLPLIAVPLASIFLLKLILSFKLFDLVHVLTFGGPGFDTTTAGFSIWRRALEEFNVGRAAAETLIYAIVIGLVTVPVVKLYRRLAERER